MDRRHFLTLAAAIPMIGAGNTAAKAAPTPDLWDHWTAEDAKSRKTVDHGPWQEFLDDYVMPSADGINYVAYGSVQGRDRDRLRRYVGDLARINPAMLSRDEQFAYWVNLYNALTIDVVLEHYPVESIRDIDISPGIFSSGPWGKALVEIDGQAVTLDDIEHRILRPIWRDPRIHYAVNCASIGCPNLARSAFTAANAERLMDEGAEAYVNHDRGHRIANGRLRVSSIYEWFDEDFGGNDAGVIDHLKQHAKAPRRQALAGKTKVAGHSYDWSLNDIAGLG